VRVRLAGVLQELVHLPHELMEKLAGRIKVMANLISYQTDLPQEGHVPASPEFGGVELRVSFFPTVRGEKIVIRIFDPRNRSFELAQLGFEEDTLQNLIKPFPSNGLILLTGPTGSQDQAITRFSLHLSICTARPSRSARSRMRSNSICQWWPAQIHPAKVHLPRALHAMAGSQVIMIGRSGTPRPPGIAVQLHRSLAISTRTRAAPRLFRPPDQHGHRPFLLASALSGVLGLRLIRINCPHCAPRPPDPRSKNWCRPRR
jgi:hypothetical protein